MHFWSPNKVAHGKEEEKGRRRRERRRRGRRGANPRYGCLTLVWNYECLMEFSSLCEGSCNCMVRSLLQT